MQCEVTGKRFAAVPASAAFRRVYQSGAVGNNAGLGGMFAWKESDPSLDALANEPRLIVCVNRGIPDGTFNGRAFRFRPLAPYRQLFFCHPVGARRSRGGRCDVGRPKSVCQCVEAGNYLLGESESVNAALVGDRTQERPKDPFLLRVRAADTAGIPIAALSS